MCGCGTPTGTKFRNGHDGKLIRRLQRAVHARELVTIYGQIQSPHVLAERVSPDFAAQLRRISYRRQGVAR
jgi:hypothetical protein